MNDKLKEFLKIISANDELKEKFSTMVKKESESEANFKALIELANECGYDLTMEDLNEEPAQVENLSDEELGQIAGGGWCGCISGGAGQAGAGNFLNDGLNCVCVSAGAGTLNLTERGQAGAADRVIVCTGAGEGACGCAGLGMGATNGVDTFELPEDQAKRNELMNSSSFKYKGE